MVGVNFLEMDGKVGVGVGVYPRDRLQERGGGAGRERSGVVRCPGKARGLCQKQF